MSFLPVRRRAFTLVELLVVMAILAILVSMMLAGLSSALNSARKTQCQSRLSNLGRGLLLYEHDHEVFPGAGMAATGVPQTSVAYTYTRSILPYLDLTEDQARQRRDFFCCPSRTASTNGTFDQPHYLFSGANNISAKYPGLSGVRSSSIKKTSLTVLAGEAAATKPFSNHPFRGAELQPDARCWLFFVDGHVEFLRIYSPGPGLTLAEDPPESYGYQWSP
jgi:prepilin-type N-terminal cleavage/methylation domain-containing protein